MIASRDLSGNIYVFACLLILVCVLTLIGWIAQYIWWMISISRKAKNIPGIKGVPFYGLNLEFAVTSIKDILDKLNSYCGVSYPIGKFWLANAFTVAVSKPEYMEKILSSKECFEKSEFVYQPAKVLIGEGLATAPYTKWRKSKKVLQPFFHMKNLQGFIPIFNANSTIFMDILDKCVGDPDVDIFEKFFLCTLDNICDTNLNVRADAQNTSSAYGHWLDSMMNYSVNRIMKAIYRIDIIYNLTLKKRIDYFKVKVLGFGNWILHEKRRTFEDKMKEIDVETFLELDKDQQQGRSFLNFLIAEAYRGSGFEEQQILDEINTFIIAGSETNSLALAYCVIMLAMHPEYQQRAYEEAIAVLGEDRELAFEDLPKFEFLEMIIKETLRLFPIFPLVMRMASGDVNLDDYVIPKGTSVLIPIITVHRDPKYWKDPLKFDPYRFLPGEFDKTKSSAYMPFTKGPRICIGLNYSQMMMKEILSKAIRRFEFKTDYKSVEDVGVMMKITLRPKETWKVTLKRRT